MAQPASNKGKFIQRLPEKPERLLVLKQKDHVPACLPLMDTGGPPTQHPGSGLPGGQGRAGAGGGWGPGGYQLGLSSENPEVKGSLSEGLNCMSATHYPLAVGKH